MKVLVTGAGALLGQGIIRSLKKSSLSNLKIIAADPNPFSAGLYWCDKKYKIPMAKADDYMDKIDSLLTEEKPDIVMIGTDVELEIFAENKKRLEEKHNTKILVSPTEIIKIADDKYLTALFLKEKNFPYPYSGLADEADAVIKKVGFPLIVKPRVGGRSIGVSKVNNKEQLTYALSQVENPVIQECVGSDDAEYTAGVLYFDGVVHGSIIMKRELRDGNTYIATVVEDEKLTSKLNEITSALKPYGPVNFQFRIDREDNLMIFEINGRFSGTTPLRALAGFNEVEMSINHLLGSSEKNDVKIKKLTFLRHWEETIIDESNLEDVRDLK